jgi:hypothetical protein
MAHNRQVLANEFPYTKAICDSIARLDLIHEFEDVRSYEFEYVLNKIVSTSVTGST